MERSGAYDNPQTPTCPKCAGAGKGVGVFEFYALDAKLDLPATATRDDLLKALEGHVIGKAAYTGRFHATPP